MCSLVEQSFCYLARSYENPLVIGSAFARFFYSNKFCLNTISVFFQLIISETISKILKGSRNVQGFGLIRAVSVCFIISSSGPCK